MKFIILCDPFSEVYLFVEVPEEFTKELMNLFSDLIDGMASVDTDNVLGIGVSYDTKDSLAILVHLKIGLEIDCGHGR
jgi:hypothetical protein